MIVVIQCASGKRADAGHLLTAEGRRVCFVAHPELAPAESNYTYARPDDSAGNASWREKLLAYNWRGDNPLALFPAYELYNNDAYGKLVDRYGADKTYILSAGWGLIRSDFLTPYYDITFSQAAEPYKRRKSNEHYWDMNMVPHQGGEDIVFFGGKDYLFLFDALTRNHPSQRLVFYNSEIRPRISGIRLQRYPTTRRTNWHYECVDAFLNGHFP